MQPSMNSSNLLRLAFAALACGVLAAEQKPTVFPLEPGLTWTYRGRVRWTGTDRRVHSDSLQWTMRIVTVRTTPNAQAALVRGWVQQLAWHEPGKSAQYTALLFRDRRLYTLTTADSASAAEVLDDALKSGAPMPSASQLLIDSTLTVDHIYGQEPKRDDFMYAWHVASVTSVAAHPAWKAGSGRVQRVRLESRTLPDHQFIDFVPGVGITRFVYSHHGTVADTDVRLVSVTR
jgi:hypothetical protein